MSCCTKATVVDIAIRTLITELVATYKARRKKDRAEHPCKRCAMRALEVQP